MCVERTRYWQDAKQLHEVRWAIVAQAMKQVASFWSCIEMKLIYNFYSSFTV